MSTAHGAEQTGRFRSANALTEAEAAEHLGLSVATLRAWRHRSKGPRFVRFGRAVRYLRADLDAFIGTCVVDTDAAVGSNASADAGELRV